ncbi:hypothetical protein EJD97_021931 [Solanum chilense]|uniref:CCHC-type domain-containing protein n=1 Tax=Solanum chilense TaxID=4083 RepID=A0A6N2B2G4_SOLCI|nr:hypothetical protein EJD97_021931 [Solanum chilense]
MNNSSQVNAGTVSIATTSVAHNHSTAVLAPTKKPAKFTGVNFKRWQHMMFFYLTTLSRREKKYNTEDVGMKKFIVAKFLEYKVIDNKTVVTQVQELQLIIHDLLAEVINLFNVYVGNIKFTLNTHIIFNVGLVVNDVFQVVAIIEKLPLLWKDFKNYLKNKRKEMTVEDLIVRVRIKEDNKAAEKRSRGNSAISGVNIVEEDPTKLKKRKKIFCPKINHPKKKFNGSCFNYGKRGHKATECWGPKKD